MADFGLAAQIGRGNAMPGAQQQQDPQNRMMQMMQLQQLQQNMMLAREQEARQAQLFGPQLGSAQQNLENLRNQERRDAELFDPRLRQARSAADVTNAQFRQQKVLADVSEEGYNVKTRLLKLRSSMEPDAMMSPDFRKTLMRSDPELAIEIDRLTSEGEKTRSELQKAGYDRDTAKIAQQKAVVGSIANSLGGVVDQQTFSTVLNELEKVDPLATKLIGPRFNGESMRKLERRLRGLQNFELRQNARGEFERIDLDTGTATVVGRASPFGSTALTEPALGANADAATFNAARAAGAVTPPYTPPGETQIIGQRAPVPVAAPTPATAVAPPPGLGPTAVAAGEKKTAELQAQKAVDDVKKQEGRQSVQETLSGMIEAYKNLGSLGELQRADMSMPKRLSIAAQARLPGDIATAVNFDAGSELTTINNLRQSLIPVLTEVMGSKAVDAARESEAILASLTSGGQSPASIARTLTNFSKKYGLGVTFKPEDLAYTPPAGAAGSARGRAAPAAAQPATPAPAAAKPTLQEFLAKARPANPNASDADLRTYYDRTYGGR